MAEFNSARRFERLSLIGISYKTVSVCNRCLGWKPVEPSSHDLETSTPSLPLPSPSLPLPSSSSSSSSSSLKEPGAGRIRLDQVKPHFLQQQKFRTAAEGENQRTFKFLLGTQLCRIKSNSRFWSLIDLMS